MEEMKLTNKPQQNEVLKEKTPEEKYGPEIVQQLNLAAGRLNDTFATGDKKIELIQRARDTFNELIINNPQNEELKTLCHFGQDVAAAQDTRIEMAMHGRIGINPNGLRNNNDGSSDRIDFIVK